MCGAVFAAALPLAARVAICVTFAALYAACVRRVVQLRGRRAVRALGWTEEGVLMVWYGARTTPLVATLAPGSFRLGARMLVLTLHTAAGRHALLLDGRTQEPAAFRRLCRHLEWPPGPRSRRGRSPS